MRIPTSFYVIWIIGLLFGCSFMAALIYVSVHFLGKVW